VSEAKTGARRKFGAWIGQRLCVALAGLKITCYLTLGDARPGRASLALGWYVAPRWGFCSSVDADVSGRRREDTCLPQASTGFQSAQGALCFKLYLFAP